MCGISGIINKNKSEVTANEIEAITNIIEHRGPDGFGYYFDENIAFGHRRLSILELSELGAQPMHYNEKYTITFNGEIYNYIEIRKELIKQGYSFKSSSDTEVILAAYDYYGESCVHQFNGMWAFAIHDKTKNVIFCSRDRFGVKPFYYTQNNNCFSFGSEIKQLLGFQKSNVVNKEILINFLVLGIEEYNNETFFSNIFKLQGGHNLRFDIATNTFVISKYYELPNETKNNTPINESEANNSFENTFLASIKLRLRSDVKVGTCLSGGLDSSSIAALAAVEYTKNSNQQFIAIHATSNQKNINESAYATIVAEKFNLDLNTINVTTDDFLATVDSVIKLQEEPFGGPSIFMQYFVFKKAKELNCTVMLDGQGGDETLLGYERYYAFYLKQLSFVEKIKSFKQMSQNSKLTLKQLVGFYFYFAFPSIRIRVLKQKHNYIKKEYLDKISNSIFNIPTNTNSMLYNLQKMELESLQLPNLLKYEDKNSMAHSIESRLPFLDYKLVEHNLNLDPKFKINDGWTKYILRTVMSKYLPTEITWRKNKLGFNAPEETWLQVHHTTMLETIKTSELLKNITNINKIVTDFNKLDLRTKWRFYNVAQWEKTYNVKFN